MMASDTDYLTDVLEGFGQRERLASSADYQQMLAVMNKLVPASAAAGRSAAAMKSSVPRSS